MTVIKEYKILAGPDRHDLFSALEYAQDEVTDSSSGYGRAFFYCEEEIYKNKATPAKINLKVRLHSIRHAANAFDLSAQDRGKEFIISGFCDAASIDVSDADALGFEAHYNTETKTGNIVFNSTALIQNYA